MLFTTYMHQDEERANRSTRALAMPGPSLALWETCPWLQAIENPNIGWGEWDDFRTFEPTGDKYVIDESDSSTTVAALTTEVQSDAEQPLGVVRLSIAGADNREAWFQHEGLIAEIDAGNGECWFETRVRISNITNGVSMFTCGLAGPLTAGDNKVQSDDTGALADINFIGFQTLTADADAVRFIHQQASSTTDAVIAALSLNSSTGLVVASQWMKLGFHFDGKRTISCYADGILQGTVCYESDDYFPDGIHLAPAWAAKSSGTTAYTFDVDWWRYFQKRVY